MLFRDDAGRVLLVEPTYKPNWEIPGGAVEADEAPWTAARRELREELGLDRPPGRLLVVDHVRDTLRFVFDGGRLTAADVAAFPLPNAELRSASFHALTEAGTLVSPALARRLESAVHAADHGHLALCEQGRRVA